MLDFLLTIYILDKFYDLKDNCNVWLSKALKKKKIPVTRIGVIEMEYDINFDLLEDKMLKSIKAYFKLLDIASTMDMEVEILIKIDEEEKLIDVETKTFSGKLQILRTMMKLPP